MTCISRIMTTNHNTPTANRLKRAPANIRHLFESTSFVVPRTAFHRSFDDRVKDTSTQTSKTLVSLSVIDSPRMSPDSLSPRTNFHPDIEDELLNLDDNETTELSFNRKSYILRYLHKPHRKQESQTLPENSLTKVFLEKNRKKHQQPDIQSPKITRSNFLQQTSPLRNIIPATQEINFKSHSYAALPESSVLETKPSMTRFNVIKIRDKPPAARIPKPVKYYCEKELALNLDSSKSSPKSSKNYSFMSPTFSSEQKNKMREIKHVTKLISPTRRGRSASPKSQLCRSPSRSSIVKKVPYIDKSSSSIFHGTGDMFHALKKKPPRIELSNSTIMENYVDINPEHELVQSISKLRDADWNLALRGLAEIIELCRTIDTNIIYPHMTVINQRIIDMLKSPRSHVCRTTCKAVGHLFEYIKDTRRPEFDEIVDTLLYRTADSNKFIRHDANLALDCMVTHIPILHAIRSLCAKGPDHKNSLVRIATARLVVCAVVLAGSSTILNPSNSDYTRRRIILNMVKFLNDKTLDARKYGERLYKLLACDKMFDLYSRRYLEKETIQKMNSCFKCQLKNGIR